MPDYTVKYKEVKCYTIPEADAATPDAAKAAYEANPGNYVGSEVVIKQGVKSVSYITENGRPVRKFYDDNV